MDLNGRRSPVRILKAFAWLRWRVVMNSLERSGARDTVERLSLAIDQLAPIMAAVLMVPSAIALAGAGAYGGWALATGNPRPLPFEALRFLMLAACVMTIVGPLLLPAAERTNAVRLLLLPISRRLLYAAQAATTLADPWVLLVVPVVVAVPAGLLAGGAPVSALIAAAAGVLLLAALLGLSSVATSLIHLLVRDRRRGELLALVFVLMLPLVAMLPGALAMPERQPRSDARGASDAGRSRRLHAVIATLERRVLPLVPSELFARATRSAAEGRTGAAARHVAALAVMGAALHAAGLFGFGLLLDSPGLTRTRRREAKRKTRVWRIPGVSRGTSAVAIAQIRLALRTPRGRSILLSPLMVFAMFTIMMWSGATAELGIVSIGSGIALAVFGSWVSLLAVLPIAMNQFAVDGAGLTLELLSPLDDGELLRGKMIGNGLIAAFPALVCVAMAAAIFPSGSAALWLTVPPAIVASYLLVAPAAAALSALFPKPVDLNSIGNGSNAHGAAGFLGFIAFSAAGALSLLLALLAGRVFGWTAMPLAMLAWCGFCALLASLLFVPARAIFVRRRENLALIR